MKSIRKTNEQFIKEAVELHGDHYDYSQINYQGAHIKTTIICKVHGPWEQTPHDHLKPQGCNSCGIASSIKLRTNSLDYFIENAKKIHNNKYTYEFAVYVRSKIKLTITCPDHGNFEQTPNPHLKGQGCPKCKLNKFLKNNPMNNIDSIARIHETKKKNNSYGKSKIEDAIYNYFSNKLHVERGKIINGWSIDFYLKDIDCYIQIDGIYYHGLDRTLDEIGKFKTETDKMIYKTILRDNMQNKWFRQNNMNLIRITDLECYNILEKKIWKTHFCCGKYTLDQIIK